MENRIPEYPPDVAQLPTEWKKLSADEADQVLNGSQEDIIIVAEYEGCDIDNLPWLIREEGTMYSNEDADGVTFDQLLASVFEAVEGVTFTFYARV